MSRSTSTTFMFHCAQIATRQKAAQKVPDQTKHRDKDAMDTFDCKGWLSITVSKNSDTVTVKLSHALGHVHYVPIDLPEDVLDIIQKNPHMTSSQVL